VPSTAQALALLAALLSAASTIAVRLGLRGSDSYTALWINLVVGTVGFWIVVLVRGGIARPSLTGVLYFVLAGLLGTIAGRLLRFMAIERVGASITAAVLNLNVLVSTILAILILGEHVTVPILTGTLVIVSGAILLSTEGRGIPFRPRRMVIPLISAVCFGVVAILRKIGVVHIGPVFGSALNVTTAMVAFAAFLLASGRRGTMTCRGRTLAWFVAAGVAENSAVFLNIVGLSLGAVSVVAPLYATAPAFVLILSFFFLRGLEALNLRVIAGTLMIVAGVYVITAFPS
jgi:drug/metabolite transporter, DME family